jgi:hypothetical protein
MSRWQTKLAMVTVIAVTASTWGTKRSGRSQASEL